VADSAIAAIRAEILLMSVSLPYEAGYPPVG
jgi:hypothetical protein